MTEREMSFVALLEHEYDWMVSNLPIDRDLLGSHWAEHILQVMGMSKDEARQLIQQIGWH